MSGANGALGADLYNRQLHPDETKKLHDLQKGKSADEQHKLAAAECALTRCAEGVPESDPDKAALTKLQNEGQRYTDEQRQLKDAGAFDGYGPADTFNDWYDRNQMSNRAGGAVQGVTGAAAAAGLAGAGCSTGVACGLALTGAATSLDWSLAGFKTAVSGEPISTYGEQVLQGLGMSPTGAALTYGLVNIGAAGGAALVDGAGSAGSTSSSGGKSGSTASVATSGGGAGKNWTGGGAQLGDDGQFLLGERQLPPARGSLAGNPEAPPPNASADQVRSIQRQNEAAQVLADHGLDVEQLPNTGKGSNPDLEINGQKADVYSPTTKNPQTIWDNVAKKVSSQAPNVVINLADSPLSASDMAQFIQRNPVPGMNTVTLVKNGAVTVLGR
jgi:filamentous hemagglutinin